MKYTELQIQGVKQYLHNLYKTHVDKKNTCVIDNVHLYSNPKEPDLLFVRYSSTHTTIDYEEVCKDIIVCFNKKGDVEDCYKKYQLADKKGLLQFVEQLQIFELP
jgi:hypothetical protein